MASAIKTDTVAAVLPAAARIERSDATLGIITGTTAWRDTDGRIWINHSIGRLIEQLREHFPQARLCLPLLAAHQSNLNHAIDFPSSSIEALPPLVSTIQSQRHFWQTRKTLRRFARESELLFIRLPFQIPSAIEGLKRPTVMHVVGNPVEVIQASSDYHGLMRRLALRFAAHSEASMRRLARQPSTRVVTNGIQMWNRLGCVQGRPAVSSCIYEREIVPRESTELRDPPRLLFVGYLRPEKGVAVLLDAFDELRKRRPLKLTLAGGSDRVTAIETAILQRIEASPFRDDIQQLGMLPFGEQLFQVYRDHDIVVQPSFSEGTPRTLVEARAFGCAVVATRVGGIPTSVEDGQDGLLVPPGDAPALAAAIERLLDDGPLRLRLIDRGRARGQHMTVENFAADIAQELRALLPAERTNETPQK